MMAWSVLGQLESQPGPQGDPGAKGPKGATGPTGAKGSTGARGASVPDWPGKAAGILIAVTPAGNLTTSVTKDFWIHLSGDTKDSGNLSVPAIRFSDGDRYPRMTGRTGNTLMWEMGSGSQLIFGSTSMVWLPNGHANLGGTVAPFRNLYATGAYRRVSDPAIKYDIVDDPLDPWPAIRNEDIVVEYEDPDDDGTEFEGRIQYSFDASLMPPDVVEGGVGFDDEGNEVPAPLFVNIDRIADYLWEAAHELNERIEALESAT